MYCDASEWRILWHCSILVRRKKKQRLRLVPAAAVALQVRLRKTQMAAVERQQAAAVASMGKVLKINDVEKLLSKEKM